MTQPAWCEVVRHYSEFGRDRLHADGERIRKPLNLTGAESADLVAFVETVSADIKLPASLVPPAVAACR